MMLQKKTRTDPQIFPRHAKENSQTMHNRLRMRTRITSHHHKNISLSHFNTTTKEKRERENQSRGKSLSCWDLASFFTYAESSPSFFCYFSVSPKFFFRQYISSLFLSPCKNRESCFCIEFLFIFTSCSTQQQVIPFCSRPQKFILE